MSKRIFIAGKFGILAMMVAFCIMGQGCSQKAQIIVVPENYKTIQKAIDVARPGDTVFVNEGIYDETIKIKKSVCLTGKDVNLVTIRGGVADGTIRIDSNSQVSIANLTFEYAKDKYNTCIEVAGGELTIKNCVIKGFTGCGMNVHDGAKGTIENCRVEGCIKGGYLRLQKDNECGCSQQYLLQ